MRALVVLGHPNKPAASTMPSPGRPFRPSRITATRSSSTIYTKKSSIPSSGLRRWAKAPSDPVLRKHCEEITGADGIMIVNPNWWRQPPACLKGWLDRVIRAGVCYEYAEIGGGLGQPTAS